MNVLEQISHETMLFMRGKYRLDEVGDGKNELKFKQGQKTILTIYIYEDKFTFLVIFGKKEREVFEAKRDMFSQYIIDYYDQSKTYHDGKWMFIDVRSLEQLEGVKSLIQIKKKPNRKPFPKQNAIYSMCGQRCDLCVHYADMNEEQRAAIIPHLVNMWGIEDWSMRCGGCDTPSCYCHDDDLCNAKACVKSKECMSCNECEQYPCIKATTADHRSMIHTETYLADDITWGILPYVPNQYEEGYLGAEVEQVTA